MIKIIYVTLFLLGCYELGHSKGPDYSDCGQTYLCFGMPDVCADMKSCTVLLKTKPVNKSVEFEIYWKRSDQSQDRYVAAGLSVDNKMGNDSVTIFTIPTSGDITHDQGYTFGRSQGVFKVNQVNVTGIDHISTSYKDGVLFASWTRAKTTVVDTEVFDLSNKTYHILLSHGPINDHGYPQHHTDRWASTKAYDLETMSNH